MGDEPIIVLVVQGMLIALSLAFVARVAISWRTNGRVLNYRPRHAVPWDALGGVFLAGALLAMSIASFAARKPLADTSAVGETAMTDTEFVYANLMIAIFYGGLGTAVVLVLRDIAGATLADFGLDDLPNRWKEDVRLGAGAALFLVGPVYVVFIIVATLVNSPSQNPTLLQVAGSSNPLVFAAAFFGAVIVAPLWEELVFRSLLQGWLERAEDDLLGWRRPNESNRSDADHVEKEVSASELEAMTDVQPPHDSFAGLTHGWAPVLISGLAFAVVHIGAGPDPVPLVLFGVIIGYVYQRTHRLLACIVCHMLFNAVSLSLALASTLLS